MVRYKHPLPNKSPLVLEDTDNPGFAAPQVGPLRPADVTRHPKTGAYGFNTPFETLPTWPDGTEGKILPRSFMDTLRSPYHVTSQHFLVYDGETRSVYGKIA